ncbi:hypothetical protein [Delftia phage PhiW-14]|uniref:Uncharacterized protein n=1 Tax=Delftia phage PhiW-14 TaxID=665032 RepID=C9DGG9_BPW14|nr:hypothetical protein DP-phiW-14_gp199 [Delftia phage PhiW-14]ACV50220.1 hypothetical protein [Delftia phage PhiW-14]
MDSPSKMTLGRLLRLAPVMIELLEHWLHLYQYPSKVDVDEAILEDFRNKSIDINHDIDGACVAGAFAEVLYYDYSNGGPDYDPDTFLAALGWLIEQAGRPPYAGPNETGVEAPAEFKSSGGDRSEVNAEAFGECGCWGRDALEPWQVEWHRRNEVQMNWALKALKRLVKHHQT